MSNALMESIAVIELMLQDIQNEHAESLIETPEVATGIQMAYKQIFNTRLKLVQLLERAAEPVAKEDRTSFLRSIRLTNIEKWVLRSLGDREDGMPAQMIRAEHDRLIANALIQEDSGRYFITDDGRALLSLLVKLPGASDLRLQQKVVA